MPKAIDIEYRGCEFGRSFHASFVRDEGDPPSPEGESGRSPEEAVGKLVMSSQLIECRIRVREQPQDASLAMGEW